MFPATPPRLISRSPTRNETEILSSFSAMKVSVNLPANIIRWSVAIDPVTAIRIVEGLYSAFGACGPAGLVEGITAGAGAGRVRVVDREALLLDGVHEVDRGAHEVRRGHLIGHHADSAEVLGNVAVERALVEVELVAQARATARLHGHPQPQVIPAFLGDQRAHLGRGGLGEDDTLLRHFVLNGHL